MIRLSRPDAVPQCLVKSGKKETESLCRQCEAGETDFNFKNNIYGDKKVKEALKTMQCDKCCFCESKISHIQYGDVEHFRPKGGCRQNSDDPMTKPGYYWLAYEWTNLFYSCQLCNQRHKRNTFPLENPDMRCRSHDCDLDKERPVFIDPCCENPEDYISFRDEVPYPIDGNERGARTIKELGLDREELNQIRKERLAKFIALVDILKIPRVPKEAKRKVQVILRSYADPQGEFSSMYKAAKNHYLDNEQFN